MTYQYLQTVIIAIDRVEKEKNAFLNSAMKFVIKIPRRPFSFNACI